MSWVITGTQKEPAGDPFFFSNVSLLLHGDGPNGSTLIRDSSSRMNTVTAVGDAQISTAQSKFGGASIAFDGNGDYLTIPYSSTFSMAAQNFTFETWLYISTSFTSGAQNIWSQRGATPGGLSIRIVGTAGGPVLSVLAETAVAINGSAVLPAAQWLFVSVIKTGSTMTSWIDGVQDATATNPNINAIGSTNNIRIGARQDFNSEFLSGYLDEVRLTIGTLRYSTGTNFTPPTAPFPDA
jgi:hypothetical protein